MRWDEIIPIKDSAMDSYSGSNLQRKDLSIDLVLQVIVKNIKFETHSYGVQF